MRIVRKRVSRFGTHLFLFILLEWTARLTRRIEFRNMVRWMWHCVPFTGILLSFLLERKSCSDRNRFLGFFFSLRLSRLAIDSSTYHPYFGCSNVYQWDYVRIAVPDDRPVSSSSGTWCGPNSGISNQVSGTNSTQRFPVSSNGKMCDARRMLSTIFSQHDGWPIWSRSSIRIARILQDEFWCRNYVVCTIFSEFSAMQSDWCAVCEQNQIPNCVKIICNYSREWNNEATHLSRYTSKPDAQTPSIMSTPSESLAGCKSTPYMANFLAFSK